jgi:hypothetical protein
VVEKANVQIAKSERLKASASTEDAAEMKGLVEDLRAAIASQSLENIRRVSAALEDLLFYLNDS